MHRCISVGSHLKQALQEKNFAAEVVAHVVQQAIRNTPGAEDLIRTVANADKQDGMAERGFLNALTECFGSWFAEKKLGQVVQEIESRSKPIRSPHARNPNKSCDLRSRGAVRDLFIEIKDYSVDFERSSKAGIQGFTPAHSGEKREWLEKKLKESFQKGANILVARLSTWRSLTRQQTDDDVIAEILAQHHRLEANQACISVSFSVPSWFEAIYLIKRSAYLKVTVQKN